MADGRERMTADCRLGNSFFSCRTEEKKAERKERNKKGGCGVICHYTKNHICGKKEQSKNRALLVLFLFIIDIIN